MRMRRRRAAPLASLAVLALLAAPAAGVLEKPQVAGQTPRAPAGLVVGRVVDAATNRPIAQATVMLVAPASGGTGDPPSAGAPVPSSAPGVLTDPDGRFLFRNLAAGVYSFPATAATYLDGGYGQRRPGGPTQPFVLGENQRTGDVTIRLWKEASIAGSVTDETGAPVPDVSVSLLRRDTVGGRATFSNVLVTNGAYTDDRGAYRFPALVPAEYLISVPSRMAQFPPGAAGMPATSAAVRLGDVLLQTSGEGFLGGSNLLAAKLPISIRADGSVVGYATTFHPGATAVSGATPIVLKSGDARSGIDVRLKATPMVRVSGTVTGPNGPERDFVVHLIPAFASGNAFERTHETAVTRTDGTGAFTFLAVPAGPFVIKAWKLPQILVFGRDPLPPDTSLWSDMPITVGDVPLTNVAIALRPGRTISGRVKFDGAATPPNPQTAQTTLSVAFEPAWPLAFGARMATRAAATGEFTTQGLPPGRYFFNLPNNFVASLRGWYFESATHGGRDLSIEPLVLDAEDVTDVIVTFSDRRSQLSGTITDPSGKPDPGAAVLIFPADYRAWIQHGMSPPAMRMEPASQTGAYLMSVRPGEYLVAAVGEDVLASRPQEAAIEAIAATATRVTIARGDARVLDLKRGSR